MSAHVGAIPEISGGEIGRGAIPRGTIADDYVAHGGRCDAGGGVDCFMTAAQRTRAKEVFVGNVLAAQIQYGDALDALRMDALDVKPEELPIFVSLTIDALATLAGGAISKAIGSIGKNPPPDLWEILRGKDADERATILGAIQSANPSWLIKQGLDVGKKAATGTLKEQRDGAALDYITELADASALAFENVRRGVPAQASDTELAVAMHSWSSSMGHTKGQYYTALKAKVGRWVSSGASRVGRRFSTEKGPSGGDRFVVRDTKLVLYQYPDDPDEPPELVLFKRDYNKVWFQPHDMDSTREPLRPDLEDQAYDQSFVEWKPVETEFAQEAIAKNREAWGVDYEVRRRYDPTPSRYMKPKATPVVQTPPSVVDATPSIMVTK